ncbi:ABC transporter ATP-binding protein [Sulfitobacter sabulilitoris]|uniref:Dipeptide ABC transporter ATP-binding protein n=1 Tax=Sulfitobacter sabulilitoris TaxID=2562655 RepID=A0A5S3PIP2_9RHOB|nr:dipeptide ABC transporter ATP-binding protein [Sulfitobacter sabulilitoris]TMM54166.1 dipeptide ABC transporter ATP-binding protein [Sulfitobacter sabulilitoris]
MSNDTILAAHGLVRHFNVGGGLLQNPTVVRAVDGIDLTIKRGETFAIVGESGCGKSTLARLLMRLLTPTRGEVVFDGRDISGVDGKALTDLRRDMQFIFQDPFSSLNPRLTVGKLVGEPLEVHAPDLTRAQRRDRVAGLLEQVGLKPEHADRYPHEFSGGQRQRIGIARALASGPKLIIGDEPVSALDVSVQAQVINLLSDLGRDLDLTLVIIAHDLAVIRHMSDRVAVMYLGQIVESGTADEVFESPRHPYTRALLDAIPEPRHSETPREQTVLGEMPSPSAPPPGCRFHTRCPFAQDNCRTDVPRLEDDADEHAVACHHWRAIAAAQAVPERTAKPRSSGSASRFALYRAAADGAPLTYKTAAATSPTPTKD